MGSLVEFKGKRVLVTGDTGFKGSWLSLWLNKLGADVVGFALPPENDGDFFKSLGLDRLIHHIDGDIRDLQSLNNVFQEFQPEYLFHLAAQAIVRYSYQEPKLTFDTNVAGSVNVLEAVRNSKSLRSVIYVTSDKCYKNKEWDWGYRENDELGGKDPYSASKAAAEIVFSAYMDSFFNEAPKLGVASVRAGNVIGGGDWANDRIVPDCVRALKKNKPIVVRNPNATRPWQHVLEPLSGYLSLALKLYDEPKLFSGSWNFGPDGKCIRTVKSLVDEIINSWGNGEVKNLDEINAPHEANTLRLNCDKSNQLLNWYPSWDFGKSVSETIHWYKDVGSNVSALDKTDEQISSYMEDSND